jgi:hypothetical protein
MLTNLSPQILSQLSNKFSRPKTFFLLLFDPFCSFKRHYKVIVTVQKIKNAYRRHLQSLRREKIRPLVFARNFNVLFLAFGIGGLQYSS